LIVVHRLDLVSAETDRATFEAECGKGAYVRAIARDLGRALGCYGHVSALRRARVGPFRIEDAVPLDALQPNSEALSRALLPLRAGLAELPLIAIDRAGAATYKKPDRRRVVRAVGIACAYREAIHGRAMIVWDRSQSGNRPYGHASQSHGDVDFLFSRPQSPRCALPDFQGLLERLHFEVDVSLRFLHIAGHP